MKAVLVIEMPSSCKQCPLRASIDNDFCVKTLLDVTEKEYCEKKPDWCPLRPAPEKKENAIGTNYQRFVKGYNACIDEILGGSEE